MWCGIQVQTESLHEHLRISNETVKPYAAVYITGQKPERPFGRVCPDRISLVVECSASTQDASFVFVLCTFTQCTRSSTLQACLSNLQPSTAAPVRLKWNYPCSLSAVSKLHNPGPHSCACKVCPLCRCFYSLH